jgi:hypothetical protein
MMMMIWANLQLVVLLLMTVNFSFLYVWAIDCWISI